MSDKNLGCCWPNVDVPCAGIVEEVIIFDGQIRVPMCEEHLKHHKMVLALYYAGKDMEEAVHLSPDERAKMVQDMGLSLDKM